MRKVAFPFILILALFNFTSGTELSNNQNNNPAGKKIETGVLIIGGGAGGVSAGIQSARSGVKSLIVEETSWLGGMLSAAGVSATDGNHKLPSGIWNEFRSAIYRHYGGPEAVSTGWVSNTLFEPHVADSIFKDIAAKEKNLQIIYNYHFLNVIKNGKKVTGAYFINNAGDKLEVISKIVIDATELGDALKDAGAGYDVGMESKSYSHEIWNPDSSYGIIQDITYAVILKDYGENADKTIPRPVNYDSTLYIGCCNSKGGHPDAESTSQQMITYGKMPNNKYMINWPAKGNDYQINAIEMTYEERQKNYQKAKNKALGFVYYMQTKLGYKNLGIAYDEFPTKDHLPFIPYNREGRRVKGLVRYTVNDILQPFTQEDKLFKTSISVGDYPIDHHIEESFKVPPIDFPRIPSFGVPVGCLIPKDVDGMIVAEKGISVSNLVNGATRLQPCVLLTGQAAGIMAAYCAENNTEPKNINIRKIQQELLDHNAYIMPYIDVTRDDPNFQAIQRIGATGIIQGYGVSFSWANQTWFYPSRNISQYEIVQGLKTNYKVFEKYNEATGEDLNLPALVNYIGLVGTKITIDNVKNDWTALKLNKEFSANMILDRRMAAVIIDFYLKPFDRSIDFHGNLTSGN
jgi:hypothetical protein